MVFSLRKILEKLLMVKRRKNAKEIPSKTPKNSQTSTKISPQSNRMTPSAFRAIKATWHPIKSLIIMKICLFHGVLCIIFLNFFTIFLGTQSGFSSFSRIFENIRSASPNPTTQLIVVKETLQSSLRVPKSSTYFFKLLHFRDW